MCWSDYSGEGDQILILAAKDVLDRIPATKFVFVGDGVPSHLMFRREMIDLSRKLGIDGKVVFVGQVLRGRFRRPFHAGSHPPQTLVCLTLSFLSEHRVG